MRNSPRVPLLVTSSSQNIPLLPIQIVQDDNQELVIGLINDYRSIIIGTKETDEIIKEYNNLVRQFNSKFDKDTIARNMISLESDIDCEIFLKHWQPYLNFSSLYVFFAGLATAYCYRIKCDSNDTTKEDVAITCMEAAGCRDSIKAMGMAAEVILHIKQFLTVHPLMD